MNLQQMFIGIDISKFKHDVAVIDNQKKVTTPAFAFPENIHGYQMFCQRIDKVRKRLKAKDIFIGMEATGSYWKNLYHFLNQKPDWSVTVINPVQTRRFAQSDLKRAITDPMDALNIARYMLEKKPEPTHLETFGLQCLKDIEKQILALTKDRNATIYRLRLELGKTFPELEQQTWSLTSQRMLIFLMNYPTAETVQHATLDQLKTLTYGKNNQHMPTPFLYQIKTLAENSIAYKNGEHAGILVELMSQRIHDVQTHICRLKKELVNVYLHKNHKPSVLCTIPGIAPVTATILEAYIGDVSRFSNYKKIVAYFGLNPTVCQSGTSKKRKSRLEKKGNARVRAILFLNVLVMIRFKVNPIYSFYQKKLDQGKPKLVAISAAMRKLLVIVYTMLKNNEPFKKMRNNVKELIYT